MGYKSDLLLIWISYSVDIAPNPLLEVGWDKHEQGNIQYSTYLVCSSSYFAVWYTMLSTKQQSGTSYTGVSTGWISQEKMLQRQQLFISL